MSRKKQPARATLPDQLRIAIAGAGLTDYELAKRAGMAPSTIGRFVRGERGLTLEVADRLCEVLGLELARVSGRRPPAIAGTAPARIPFPHTPPTKEMIEDAGPYTNAIERLARETIDFAALEKAPGATTAPGA